MTDSLTNTPLPFDPAFEQVPDDEAESISGLIQAMREITETTYADGGHAIRSVHAKSHGLLQGEIEVLEGLPPELAQGAFAKPGRMPVVMRFSTNPGDILDDKVSTPRGLAIKLIGVEGERLPNSEGQVTQDFVMVNAPAFLAPTPKAFLKSVKLLAKTTDKAPRAKQALSAALRGAESLLEKVGGESPTLKGMGGHPMTNLLGETYYSVVPVLYGRYFAKLSLVPVSPELKALTDQAVDLSDKPNGLREAISAHFASHGGSWELRVQLATDIDKMPVEDASVVWPEELSPFITVARIDVKPQIAWSEPRAQVVDDQMSFSPWHGLAAHRPLGGIMRSRKPAYEMSSEFRARHNGCPMHEPKSLDRLPE
ncbi:catalase family protein [Stutzerimonas zhaodongensis]|uniref:catalase family protein n=1 Tax=Stutzerimonas zhaodongensis TaxID=1176257 RepID=UPI002105076B|nr:catalase family protein [Stutzerimonas zhaodongensis]MCQ2030191.1 catalase family protein [Stutzerimonas zhaodongensis]